MKRILCIIHLLLAAIAANAEVPAGWSTNLPAAFLEAGTNHNPALLYFTASWCGPCKLMARTTLTNEAVLQALADLNCVALDIDAFPKIAEQHSVRAVPTFELVSPAGDEVVRTTGYQTAEDFVQWLTNGVLQAKEAAIRQGALKEKLSAVDQWLAAGDADSARKAAAELFEICGERDDSISQAAVSRMKSLASRDPILLLDGLSARRLASRIQVANVLRERLGDEFSADPWSDASDRQRVIDQWRAKLAAVSGNSSRSD